MHPAGTRTFSARSKLCWMTVAFMMISSLPATASLGGLETSVLGDQEQLKGTRRVTVNAAYSVHEIQAATGTTVREFVSPAGTVFAVAWQGPFTPSLRQILGSYFDQYKQAIQNRRARSGPISVRQGNLVVETGGHMRSFFGRAYLPQMLPPDVTARTIK